MPGLLRSGKTTQAPEVSSSTSNKKRSFKAKKSTKCRSDSIVNLIGSILPEIKGEESDDKSKGTGDPRLVMSHYSNKLPTNGEVLRHFLAVKQLNNLQCHGLL